MRKYLLFGLVVLLAGCGAGSPPAAAPSSAPPSSSVPSAAPAEAPKDLATYVPADADLAAAHLKAQGEPSSYFISTSTPLILLSVCGEAHAWDAKAKAGEKALWASSTPGQAATKQFIGRYDGVTGADVVNGIKQAVPCGTVKDEDGSYVVMADLDLPRLAGADAQYGFCGGLDGSRKLGRCFLLLASGDRASVIITGSYPQTEKQQRAMLTAAAPAFAAALAKA